MASLTLTEIRKAYGKAEVIRGVNLDIGDGEFVVFVGPSGCGKSTLLRTIAGLEDITSGELKIGDRPVNDVRPSERGVAMVFQTYALYPHMTVAKNMAFGLLQAKTPKDEIDQRVKAAAKILQIEDYLDRLPKNLSGGQRQRVAIGRAIVREPEVFLFDEPLSNLDAALRVQTRLEIAKLHEDLGTTMIYVTHDQVEAMTLADRIVVLRDGVIEQVGSPKELYDSPANEFVAGFIGSPKMNFFDGDGDGTKIRLAGGGTLKGHDKGPVRVGIRPEHLRLGQKSPLMQATLEVVEYLGESTYLHLRNGAGEPLIIKSDDHETPPIGAQVGVCQTDGKAHVFADEDRTEVAKV